MTWIRWETTAPRNELVGALSERLTVQAAQAFGHFAAVCCGFGEYRVDGRADLVSDTTLEDWAIWRGRPGRFAAAFRDLCVERREGQRDAVGVLKGWWRQQALLQKQARDAEKRHPKNQPETPEKPPQNPRGLLGGTPAGSWGNDNDDGYGDGNQSSAKARDVIPLVSPVEYAQRCTGAANRGLRENKGCPGFNELVASNQLEHAVAWHTAGIPVDVAAGVILDRATTYRATASYRQPSSLKYFDRAVRDAWDRHQSNLASEGVEPITPAEPEDEYIAAGKRLDAEARRAAKPA